MSEKIKKGEYQGECNRSACSNPKAEYFDYSTRKYYCASCAKIINMENELYAHSMYAHDLCIKEKRVESEITVEDIREFKKQLSEAHLEPRIIVKFWNNETQQMESVIIKK